MNREGNKSRMVSRPRARSLANTWWSRERSSPLPFCLYKCLIARLFLLLMRVHTTAFRYQDLLAHFARLWRSGANLTLARIVNKC